MFLRLMPRDQGLFSIGYQVVSIKYQDKRAKSKD